MYNTLNNNLVLVLQINEDLFGEVKFLAQTGPLSVPIKCTTKKCDVSGMFKTKYTKNLSIYNIPDCQIMSDQESDPTFL